MNELGDELRALRREVQIGSQEELAKRSGVSRTTIKNLESGAVTDSRPSTFMLLARGLASDARQNVDGAAAEVYYSRLLRAAGMLPKALMPADDEDSTDRVEFLRTMERRTGRQDIAIAASTVAWNYDRIPARHRRVFEEMLLGLAEDIDEEDAKKP